MTMTLQQFVVRVVVNVAVGLSFFRETTANHGEGVEECQRAGGQEPAGQPWCVGFVCKVGRTALRAWWPVPVTLSCDEVLEWARRHGLLRDEPAPGALFLRMASEHDARHIGFVSAMLRDGWASREGNAADPDEAASDEGKGAFRRERGHVRDRARYRFVYWWEALREDAL